MDKYQEAETHNVIEAAIMRVALKKARREMVERASNDFMELARMMKLTTAEAYAALDLGCFKIRERIIQENLN